MTAMTVEQTVQVGDFFVCSWGYDQTNIDFYRVVKVSSSGKTVTVQEWEQVTRYSGSGQDWCAPGNGPRTYPAWKNGERDGEREAKMLTRRLRWYSSGACFSVESYSVATQWAGQPTYSTAQGWGH